MFRRSEVYRSLKPLWTDRLLCPGEGGRKRWFSKKTVMFSSMVAEDVAELSRHVCFNKGGGGGGGCYIKNKNYERRYDFYLKLFFGVYN